MNKTGTIILVIVIVILVVAGIWYGVSKKLAVPETKEPIKIGVVLPLVGDIADWGESMKAGIDIAVSERNNISGQKAEVIFEDNKSCDKAASISAFTKLISIDRVKATLVACSGAVLATAPIAEANKVILLTPVSSAAKISEAGDYIFRTCISDAVQGRNLGEYLLSKMNLNNVGVIYVNNDYGVGFFENFKAAFENGGGNIVQAEAYNSDAADFKTNLTKIKEKNPVALVVISYGKEGGLIAKQARELGVNMQIVGSDNFGVKEVIETGGEATEGAIFVTSAIDDESEKVKNLKSEFISRYGREPSIMLAVATAYDATNLLLDAIAAKGYNSDGIKDYLYSVKDYDGVSGRITIDVNGDSRMPSTIQQIKNGQFVPYKE